MHEPTDAVWVLERMKRVADADLSEAFDETGDLLPPKKWPEHLKHLILSVKVVEMAGGVLVNMPNDDGSFAVSHVPMYTKEVRLEPRAPTLAKLLAFVSGAAPAPVSTTNNVQVYVDKLMLALRVPQLSSE